MVMGVWIVKGMSRGMGVSLGIEGMLSSGTVMSLMRKRMIQGCCFGATSLEMQ
ncbi:hypothetical protein Hanom_Chr10g00888931 [Helianthus anomalus]